MRVALVHLRQSGTGGTERYLNQMAAHLCDAGHEVNIVCRSFENPPHPDVKFVRLRTPTLGSTWRNWAFARAVETHVSASSYDVVYGLGKAWTHDVVRLGGGCHQTYLDLAHRFTQSAWERALHRGWLKQRVALAIEARALAPGNYRAVIVNSEMVKRDAVRRHRIPAERVQVIYNGVDTARFDRERHAVAAKQLRQDAGASDRDVVVLFLGTGYGRKGLAWLLDAFAQAHRQQSHLRLWVVGYDSAQASYQRQAESLGVGSAVHFFGGRRDAEICYAAADVYVLPTHYDPFANSTLEALASGLPVITTDKNGGHEVLRSTAGSVLRGDADIEALADEFIQWSSRERIEAARPHARAIGSAHPQADTMKASTAVLAQASHERTRRGA